ncbi:MAG: helix-turn-helix transcriptional regulator [Dethiobacter sp.]|nr:helix-turn-helix transcriptional regulator [Dethiobacter sp.]
MDREDLLKHKLIFESLGRDYFKIRHKPDEMNVLGNVLYNNLTFHQEQFAKDLPKNPKVFHKYLAHLIYQKGVNYSDVWKAAGIDSSIFSKYISGKRSPAKDTLLRIIFALELSLDEAVELLKLNGMAFDENSIRDNAFWYCLKTRFSLDDTIEFLKSYQIVVFA